MGCAIGPAGVASAVMQALPLALPAFEPGSVWLVGAGPGDPGLLSLYGLHALQHADVIVYDALVDTRILQLARPGATLEFAGKRGGRPSPSQPDISDRLIRHARAGQRVLRLKGGDPFVFGRGGEEIEALAGEGVAFEVVPGVTAAAGAAAYAGIPLTHRDYAQTCVLATGHLKDGSAQLDWAALARPRQTVVIYMGVGGLAQICAGLIEHGLAPELPAALVEKATWPGQRVVEGTLATLPAAAAAAGVKPPALFIAGEVVRLRERLAWFGTERVAAAV